MFIECRRKNEGGLFGIRKILTQKSDSVECDIIIEAENCEQNAGAYAESAVSGYLGTGYAKICSNVDFKLRVDISASQHYTITAVHRADDYKENPLLIGGAKVMSIISGKDWKSTTAENIFLEKGENVITLGDEIYGGISESLSNKNTNAKTQRIYNYLRDIYGKRTILGQCTLE